MGLQSARLYYQGNDHKDIYFQGMYHKAMYVGSQLVWRKLPQSIWFESSIIGYLPYHKHDISYFACAIGDNAIIIRIDNIGDGSYSQLNWQKISVSKFAKGTCVKKLDSSIPAKYMAGYVIKASADPYILFCRPVNGGAYICYTKDGENFAYTECYHVNISGYYPVLFPRGWERAAICDGVLLLPNARCTNYSPALMQLYCEYSSAMIDDSEGSLFAFKMYLNNQSDNYNQPSYTAFATDPVTGKSYAIRSTYNRLYANMVNGQPYCDRVMEIGTSVGVGSLGEENYVSIVENQILYLGSFSNTTRHVNGSYLRAYAGKLFMVQSTPTEAVVVLDVRTKEFTEIPESVSVENLYYVDGLFVSVGEKVICYSVDGFSWNIQQCDEIPASDYTSCYVANDGIYICSKRKYGDYYSDDIVSYIRIHSL